MRQALRNPQDRRSWVVSLRRLIERVTGKVLSGAPGPLRPCRVLLRPKDSGNEAYRVIASYTVEDSLIIGQTARYLRHLLDDQLLDGCCAFRVARREVSIDRDQAVRSLQQYRTERPGQALWVCELDLSAFYDCVSHDVARRALADAVRVASLQGKGVDARALGIVDAMLDGYEFREARSRALSSFSDDGMAQRVPWPEEELRRLWGEGFDEQRFGLAQGAALANLLGNLAVHPADRSTVNKVPPGQLLNLRYCDDIVLVGTVERVLRLAWRRCLRALRRLRLPYHRPTRFSRYGAKHWDRKSRSPYRWVGSSERGSTSWVGFLGYQVDHEGRVRPRKTSRDRQLEKQRKVVDAVLFEFRRTGRSVRRAPEDVLRSVRGHLVWMSVGRGRTDDPCWSNGFRLLGEIPFVRAALKRLDRGREQQMNRLRRALLAHDETEAGAVRTPKRLQRYGSSYVASAERRAQTQCPPSTATSCSGSAVCDVPARVSGVRVLQPGQTIGRQRRPAGLACGKRVPVSFVWEVVRSYEKG